MELFPKTSAPMIRLLRVLVVLTLAMMVLGVGCGRWADFHMSDARVQRDAERWFVVGGSLARGVGLAQAAGFRCLPDPSKSHYLCSRQRSPFLTVGCLQSIEIAVGPYDEVTRIGRASHVCASF